MKIIITAKFRGSRRLRFEDTKGIMSPEKFRDFRETGPRPWNPITPQRIEHFQEFAHCSPYSKFVKLN